MTFVHDLHAHLPKTTKDFWVIALPPAGVPSQSFALKILKDKMKRTFCFGSFPLSSAGKQVFYYRQFSSPTQTDLN